MVQWLARIRDAIKRIYAFCVPLRFSFLALAILAFAFWFSDQGWDILRALVEDHVGQVGLRIFAFLFISFLLALEIWYWSRHLLRYRPKAREVDDPCRDRIGEPLVEDAADPEDWLAGVIVRVVPRLLGALVFVIEIIGLLLVKNQYRNESPRHFWVTIIFLAILFVVYAIFVAKRRDVFKLGTDSQTTTIRQWKDVEPTTKKILIFSVAVEVVLFVWALINPVSWWILGAGAVLVLTVAVWVPLGSYLVGVGERLAVPILTLLLLWAVAISACTDNHIIRSLNRQTSRRSLQQAYDEWHTRAAARPLRDANGKIPIVIVATEGGGIRAAYWTATVLAALQDELPPFKDQLFAISCVSGGSYGATVFDALLARRAELNQAPSGGLQSEVRKLLSFDSLSGTLASLCQPDLFQRFFPAPVLPDRAAALEEGWEAGWRSKLGGDLFSRGLLDLFARHDDLPLLFLNGTTVELGDRIITTPVDFRQNLEFRNAHDAFQKFGPNVDLRLSTASLMSARFTYVSPAGKVPNRDPKDRKATCDREVFAHVVDGGYFENSGGVTAAEIVSFLAAKGDVQPYVIVIDYWNTECDACAKPPCDKEKNHKPCPTPVSPFCPAYGAVGPPPPDKLEKVMNEVMSPLRAVLAARGARGQQAVGDVVLQSRQKDQIANVIEFRLVPHTVPLPLGWVLSEQAMDAIDRAMPCEQDNRAGVAVVASVLGAAAPPPMRCGRTLFPLPPPMHIRCDTGGCPGLGSSVEKGEVQ